MADEEAQNGDGMAVESINGLVVRDVRVDDLEAVARLHVEAFPESVLGRLGIEAVRRSYEWQLDGPHDLTALVGVHGDVIQGFLFGGVFRGSTIGFVKREKWFLIRQVLRRPRILRVEVGRERVVLALRLLGRRWKVSVPENPSAVPRSSFGVLAIAVAPESQGTGVGQTLMATATASAVSQGFEAMHLSVHPENAAAMRFYRKLGWEPMNEPDGTWIGRMRLALVHGS